MLWRRQEPPLYLIKMLVVKWKWVAILVFALFLGGGSSGCIEQTESILDGAKEAVAIAEIKSVKGGDSEVEVITYKDDDEYVITDDGQKLYLKMNKAQLVDSMAKESKKGVKAVNVKDCVYDVTVTGEGSCFTNTLKVSAGVIAEDGSSYTWTADRLREA